jgi:ribosomal protein S18 acetylase RimI-like enzyme
MRHHRHMRATDHPAGRHRRDDVRIVALTPNEFIQHADEAMAIYARAMGYSAQTGVQRAITARRHAGNAGFACRVAEDLDGTLLGFGYGYTTQPGQWWHDLVRRALSTGDEGWLHDAFELSEMHVLPSAQGAGLGRRILEALSTDIDHEAMLLSTPDSDTRAFRLYRSMGFVDLARNYLFPGDSRPFAVLGAQLPLVIKGE